MLTHFQQAGQTTCGAVAFRIIMSDVKPMTEKEAKKECKTGQGGKRGTYDFDVLSAFRKHNIDANLVRLDVDFEEYSRWLKLNSMGRKLYLSCNYRDKACGGKGGRDAKRCHAVVVCDGIIYDPSEAKPVPIEAYFDVYSKSLSINSMIMIDCK